MLKKFLGFLLPGLILLGQASPAAADVGTGTLFAITGNQQLVSVDPTSGAFTLLTDLNTSDNPQSFDLASDPVIHRLYLIRAFVTFDSGGPVFHQNLLTVDSRTGAILSQPDLTGTAFPALMVDASTGDLFGFDGRALVKINPTAGTSTVVATMTTFACVNSVALDSSSGLVYLAQESCGSIETVTTQLFTINDKSGSITPGLVLDRPVRQIALDSGNLYGVTEGPTFDYVAIDKTTGHATLLANLGDGNSIIQFGTATNQASHTTFIDVGTRDAFGNFNDSLVSMNNVTGDATSAPLATGFSGNGMAFEPEIVVTQTSARADVTSAITSGAIDNAGVGKSLLSLLDSAARAAAQGQCKTAANIYQGFTNQVNAQSGRHIATAIAGRLLIDARALSASCP